MSRCEETRGRLDDWLDGLLDQVVQEHVARHLRECADCRRFFEQHRQIEQDVWRLGLAADRLASAPADGNRVKTHWRSVLRIAAAVLVVVTTGFIALQYRHAGHTTPSHPDRGVLSGKTPVNRSLRRMAPPAHAAPSDFSVTVDDSYMAVRLESSNPRIQIVWLYPMAQPAKPQGDDDGGDVNDTSIG